MIHIEKEHIGDSWLVNTKREQNMMNSENESKKTKTDEPKRKKIKETVVTSEERSKSLSDMMDEKVLLNRTLENERELLWQKGKEKNKKNETRKKETG